MFKIDESRITLAKALEDLSHNEWAVADWRDNAVVNVDCEDAFKSMLLFLASFCKLSQNQARGIMWYLVPI